MNTWAKFSFKSSVVKPFKSSSFLGRSPRLRNSFHKLLECRSSKSSFSRKGALAISVYDSVKVHSLRYSSQKAESPIRRKRLYVASRFLITRASSSSIQGSRLLGIWSFLKGPGHQQFKGYRILLLSCCIAAWGSIFPSGHYDYQDIVEVEI